MAKIPKKWRGVDGQLHHLVNRVMDSDTLDEIVVSRTWRSRYQVWVYHAQKVDDFEAQAAFRRTWEVRAP